MILTTSKDYKVKDDNNNKDKFGDGLLALNWLLHGFTASQRL